MNNTIKGAAAAAAAGILLLGGYGTLAQWGDDASLNGGSVNAGQLKLVDTTTGVWRDASGAEPVVIDSIADYKVIPGDVLTYEVSADIEASGANLAATLEADKSTVTGGEALLKEMDVATDVTIAGVEATEISEANDGETVDVKVTFAFGWDEATDASQLQSLDLSGLELVLAQS